MAASLSLGQSCPENPRYVVRNLRAGAPDKPCYVTLAWDPPVPAPPSGIQQYWVYRIALAGLPGTFVRTVPAGTLSVIDATWLEPDGYGYMVRVKDNNGFLHQGALVGVSPHDCPLPLDPELETKVLLVSFADVPSPPYSLAEVGDKMFDAPNSVAAFWETNSYGTQRILRSEAGVYGPFVLPGVRSDYCNTGCSAFQIAAAAVAEADASVDFSGVDRLVVSAPELVPSGTITEVDTAEGGAIPSVVVKSFLEGFSNNIVEHELGHVQTAKHAAVVDCDDLFPTDPFDHRSGGCVLGGTDYFEKMSTPGVGQGFYDQFSAFHKLRMGILPADRITSMIPAAAPQDVRLYALEEDIAGTQMLQIPIGVGAFYFLEYRHPPDGSVDTVLMRAKFGLGDVGSDQMLPVAFVDGSGPLDVVGGSVELPAQNLRIWLIAKSTDGLGPYALLRVTTVSP